MNVLIRNKTLIIIIILNLYYLALYFLFGFVEIISGL